MAKSITRTSDKRDYPATRRSRSRRRETPYDDSHVLADGAVGGRIFHAAASPVGSPWIWTLAFGHHEDCTPTHGYEPTREAAMAAFAKSWWRGYF